ncbi:MAG: short-chain dehydrogenase [Odoribacter sp.]|nr:short-chain dehydrogenase [Odoribacter sp.]
MNIIITGGSGGIGREIAYCLSEDRNNNILITGRNPKSLAGTADTAIEKNIRYLVSDFANLHLAPEVFKNQVLSVFETVDILINNAGCLYSKRFAETSDEQAREMMEVNFFAPMLIIKTLLPLINMGAHIVNISSMGGFQGSAKFPGLSYYSASKAAIACMSECLAGELKEKKISVNCLAPGSVQTEMVENAFPGYKAPVTAAEMGKYIADFALTGSRLFNGKIIPVSFTTP